MVQNPSEISKEDVVRDVTNYVIWKIINEWAREKQGVHIDLDPKERRIIAYCSEILLNIGDNDNYLKPFIGKDYPQYAEKNIELIRVIAKKMFSDWLYENKCFLSKNNEVTKNYIYNKCYCLLYDRWEKYLSCFIDTEKLFQHDPEVDIGKIKWYDQKKGFGVIEQGEETYFVHQTNLSCNQHRLTQGTQVNFTIRKRKNKQSYEAINVEIVQNDKPNDWLEIVKSRIMNYDNEFGKYINSKLPLGKRVFLKKEQGNFCKSTAISVFSGSGDYIGHLDELSASLHSVQLERFNESIPAWISDHVFIPSIKDTVIFILYPINDFNNDGEINEFKLRFKPYFEVGIKPRSKPTESNISRYEEKQESLDVNESIKQPHNYWYSTYQVEHSQKQKISNEIRTNVVGVTYEGRQSIVAQLNVGETVLLRREPTNYHDKNAIMVLRTNGQQIGYIKREMAAWLARKMDQHREPVKGIVKELTGGYYSGSSLGVIIYFTVPNGE